jgi:rhodanese-related sulfurtransferase
MFLLRILGWGLIKLLIRLQFLEIQQLSTEDLATWLRQDGVDKPLLLDARTKEEYEVSHLENARLAPSNLEDLVNQEGINFSTPIVVYCSVGYRSAASARRLQFIGYQNVFNLSGSIFQWVNENRLVYRGEKTVNKVHPYRKFWQYLLRVPESREI